jgi:hypothetical protein
MRLALFMSLALTAAASSTPALAQSLKLKEVFADDRPRVAELASQANAACGSNIQFSVDYDSYSQLLADDNNQKPWAYLANATDALKRVCQSPEGKQAVQAKIKSVVVSNGANESESLTNGVFHYTVPYAGHSPATVVQWLQSNL